MYRRFQGIFLIGWGGGFEGRGLCGENLSSEEYVMGEEKFNEGGAGFSNIIIKKKQWKNKYEKFFPTEGKEQH